MTARHYVLIVEDDPKSARVLEENVRSMDFDCRVVTTLEGAKAAYAEREPCAVLQDMEIPHAAGARPHDKAGESNIRAIRAVSSGPKSVPIVIVTALPAKVDFVWRLAKLDANDFVEKANIGALPDKLAEALRRSGREDHARCAECNAASRPTEGAARTADVAATLFGPDRHGVAIDAMEMAAVVARRAEYDLFLDFVTDDARGRLAGYRDHDGVFHEAFLGETSAGILAELVQARRVVRADALKRTRGGGQESAVRLVQKARQAVDVHAIVRGKESRTEWRAFHTMGEKGATAFVFEPPVGMTYAVLVKEKPPA
jgi:DNA-binding response OmpR family regulator